MLGDIGLTLPSRCARDEPVVLPPQSSRMGSRGSGPGAPIALVDERRFRPISSMAVWRLADHRIGVSRPLSVWTRPLGIWTGRHNGGGESSLLRHVCLRVAHGAWNTGADERAECYCRAIAGGKAGNLRREGPPRSRKYLARTPPTLAPIGPLLAPRHMLGKACLLVMHDRAHEYPNMAF